MCMYIDRRARNHLFWYGLIGHWAWPRQVHTSSSRWHEAGTGMQYLHSRFLCQLNVLRKQISAKPATAQACYKRNFDRTVRWILQFCLDSKVSLIHHQRKMTESARMPNVALIKLMSKTVGPFRIISETLHTVTLDENDMHNIVSPAWRTLSRGNAVEEDRAHQTTALAGTVHRRQKTESTKPRHAGWWILSEHMVGHVETANWRKYVIRWYGYGPNADTVVQPSHITQHFGARYWGRRKNMQKLKTCKNWGQKEQRTYKKLIWLGPYCIDLTEGNREKMNKVNASPDLESF